MSFRSFANSTGKAAHTRATCATPASKSLGRHCSPRFVDKLDKLEMGDRDTKGDVYEYMLAKIASAGQNGQFRTPRHIIATMVGAAEARRRDLRPHSLVLANPPFAGALDYEAHVL
jgi:hypothetical protein